MPKPRVYIVDDPAPNAFAFGRSPSNSGVAVTTGLLNLMSRRELEGVLAHEMSHVRNRDVQVTTLAVTTVGILVAVAEIAARMSWFADWGDDDDNGGGAIVLIAVAALAGVLAFGARILSLAISRHREELADVSAAELVSPDGIRKALEKLEADHTVVHHVSRATAHLWLVTPLATRATIARPSSTGCSTRTRRSTSASRSCASSKGSTRTSAARSTRRSPACPSTSTQLAHAAERRAGAAPVLDRRAGREHPHGTRVGRVADGAPVTIPRPGQSPPGWFRRDATTLRYWNGNVFTDWRATWNGTRWVQSREPRLRLRVSARRATSW